MGGSVRARAYACYCCQGLFLLKGAVFAVLVIIAFLMEEADLSFGCRGGEICHFAISKENSTGGGSHRKISWGITSASTGAGGLAMDLEEVAAAVAAEAGEEDEQGGGPGGDGKGERGGGGTPAAAVAMDLEDAAAVVAATEEETHERSALDGGGGGDDGTARKGRAR